MAFDSHERVLNHVSDAIRVNGTCERIGSVHEVYAKGGEQKIRVVIGKDPQGQDLYSPWLHTNDHRGTHREEKKYHKGQNVVITCVGGDWRNASIRAHAEQKDHKRPDHADDNNHTYQYGKMRRRHGADFHETWLAKDSSGSGGSGGGGLMGRIRGLFGDSSSTSSSSSDDKDPDKSSVVLARYGKKPDSQQDKNQPWDGPDPNGGSSQKRVLHWAGNAGDTPQVSEDSVHTAYGKSSFTQHKDGQITHQAGGSGAAIAGPADHMGSGSGVFQHIISSVAQSLFGVGGGIFSKAGNSQLSVTLNEIRHAATAVNTKGNTVKLDGSIMHLFSGSPILTKMMKLGASPVGGLTDRFDPDELHMGTGADDIFITSSFSGPAPPTDVNDDFPYNGARWHDTTSGIEYAWYNGTWSEDGGNIAFPATPTVGQLFSFAGRQWKWNGIGWESTLSSRATSLEGRATALETRATNLETRATADEGRITILETVIDGGTF